MTSTSVLPPFARQQAQTPPGDAGQFLDLGSLAAGHRHLQGCPTVAGALPQRQT